MALVDYQLCQVCASKAFYDANLNYENALKTPPEKSLHPIEGSMSRYNLSGIRLDYCAQIAAICHDCYSSGWRLKVSKTQG